jgi:tRNA(fMet)-specific endonuclease VapC
MSFLLDTNICSAHISRPAGLMHRFQQHGGRLYVPTIVFAELYVGACRLPSPSRLLAAIGAIATDLHVVDFDLACARRFGELMALMSQQGTTMSFADGLIAAMAMERNLTLVTHNTADFVHVPGLRLVDWLTP